MVSLELIKYILKLIYRIHQYYIIWQTIPHFNYTVTEKVFSSIISASLHLQSTTIPSCTIIFWSVNVKFKCCPSVIFTR